ncbi:assimilatory sulfite reductase (NADPH) flavoprotein subunit [Halobacillus rhizosphaerae]|uniref:assimilatory sulfite reductase (NADPH) flavoprotein subunit n=1 Tax=Halobacillus rhizosphaerae TaxID=3064889 RepID=UPI00398B3E26
MQFQVTNSPFNQEQADLLNQLLPTLTETQKVWLSGYLANAQSAGAQAVADAENHTPETNPASQSSLTKETREITLLYGSHTGNGEALTEEMTTRLEDKGFKVTRASMDEFKAKNLKKVQDLLVVTSTHGDGDPPDNAISLYDFLYSKRAPKLEEVRFSVLSLGDSSYEFFCQTGKDFDARLEELGGTRLYPRMDCDLDFEDPAEEWFQGVLNELSDQQAGIDAPSEQPAAEQMSTEQIVYSKKNPFKAEILENLNLNGRGSNKETRHLELDLEGSNLEFEPGDSLGIVPENDPELVNELLTEMSWDPEENVPINKQGDVKPLREALTSIYEITCLTKPLLEKAAELTDNEKLHALLSSEDREELKNYIYGRDLIDFIRDFGLWKITAQNFVRILRKLPVRLYSIASSSKANPDEVHITVGALRYDAHGRGRKGVCSGQCAERSLTGDSLPVFIQRNANFKLPENADTPIIMIGAGTGVAPYRAFLEEREEIGHSGNSWLFFGEQHFVTDFLYQIEWQRWLKDGVLSRMDVAFSRDTEKKIYVQHRMQERSKELYEWLESGATIYVCGDEKFMAKDVHQTFVSILKQEGSLTEAEAEAYLAELRAQKRYQRDVY